MVIRLRRAKTETTAPAEAGAVARLNCFGSILPEHGDVRHHGPAIDRQPYEVQPRTHALARLVREIPRQHVPPRRHRTLSEVTHHASRHVEHLGGYLRFLRQTV